MRITYAFSQIDLNLEKYAPQTLNSLYTCTSGSVKRLSSKKSNLQNPRKFGTIHNSYNNYNYYKSAVVRVFNCYIVARAGHNTGA